MYRNFIMIRKLYIINFSHRCSFSELIKIDPTRNFEHVSKIQEIQ